MGALGLVPCIIDVVDGHSSRLLVLGVSWG